eukprot:TRINITY_DN1632_c3_g1_i1.p1 TRINITY_DN1632_c3_g1~~TRINITY_DN1632_c3_g1_i1.p1  ORF type:complete len:298 (-),score=96.70 TRINITY_DN1632_c3_g1_i1:64-957(-)
MAEQQQQQEEHVNKEEVPAPTGAPSALLASLLAAATATATATAAATEANAGCATGAPDASASASASVAEPPGTKFVVTHKKQELTFTMPLESTVGQLKQEIFGKTMVPTAMQKLLLKGANFKNDATTLKDVGLKEGCKILLVGNPMAEVMQAMQQPTPEEKAGVTVADKEPLCQKPQHKKILDKGLPDDVEPGVKNRHESLPPFPIKGLLNNRGDKVRLTFKMYAQELWISLKDHTDKMPFITIRNVTFELITGHEEYAIVQLHMGQSENSRYTLYWVPAQYARAIRNSILNSGPFM